jgi:hypothetical protein
MKLQSFLKILLLSNIALGQVTLSKEEVRNKIDSLQTLDSLNNSIILDYKDKVKINSVVVAELEHQIKTHEETIKLLGKKIVLVKPKWYESKFVWGIIGSAPAYYIGYLIGKL